MVANYDYVKKILQQALDSHKTIQTRNDQPGDLEVVKKEVLKINGFFNVLLKKLASEDFQSRELRELKPKIENYLKNYYFVQEIDTMSPLYSDDPHRIKNMRLKILEAFEDKKLIDKIEGLVDDL